MRDWSSERMEVRRLVVAGSESGIVGLVQATMVVEMGRGERLIWGIRDGFATLPPPHGPGWDLLMILRIMRGLGPRVGGRGCNHWIGLEGVHCLVVVAMGKWANGQMGKWE